MLPSLCPVMAAIPPVSRFPRRRGGAAHQFNWFTCRLLAASVRGLWHAY
jgi:hypothetical protein